MRGTKKIRSNKFKKTLKRRTVTPKIFIRRFGDFVLCYRVNNSKPICLRKQYNSIRGGANPIDNDTMKSIMMRLITEITVYVSNPANKKTITDNIIITNNEAKEDVYKTIMNEFIKQNESKLLDDIMEKYAKPTTEEIYNQLFTGINSQINNGVSADKITIFKLKNELLPDIGINLLKIILTRASKIYYIEAVKKILKTQVDQKIISKDTEIKILKTLEEKPTSMMSKASAITDKAFAGISSGALKLAQWISPSPAATDAPKHNETTVQLFWYPLNYIQYAKGKAIPSEKTKYGDMVVKIQDKYANLSQYFLKSVNGVDDLLANMANGCKDATCKTGYTHPKPFKIKTLTTKEYFSKSGTAPEIELKTT